MRRIAALEAILADTGPFCRLAEAGEAQLEAACYFLRPNLKVVVDVHKELRRRATFPRHARLRRLELLGTPKDEPITITDRELLARIETILDGRRRLNPAHADKDRGEVATALVAADLGLPVLMDDGFGKNLAAKEGVDIFTTQDLAIELAAGGKLKRLHAHGIHRIVYEKTTREEFDMLVEAAKP